MGYVKEKYVSSYFLKKDADGHPVWYGAEGVTEFEEGGIRSIDKSILDTVQIKDKSVLEIGFGRGEAIKYCALAGAASICAVDFSEDAYKIASAFLRKHQIVAELHCEEALAFVRQCHSEKRYFDIVILLDVIEHIPREELTVLFSDLRFVLSPTAVLAVNTPAYVVDNDVISDGLDPRAMDSSDQIEATKGMHCNRFTGATLCLYLAQFGFTALSGHLFAYRLRVPTFAFTQRWAFIHAANIGYPVRIDAVNAEVIIERARPLTREEITTLQNLHEPRQDLPVPRSIPPLERAKRIIPKPLRRMLGRMRRRLAYTPPIPRTSQESGLGVVEITAGPARGCKMLLDPNSPATWNKDIRDGVYDAFIYDDLKFNMKLTGAVVWDVGAHIGYHSLCFSRLVGQGGKVVSFEPNRYNRDRLLKHLEMNPHLLGRVHVIDFALSDINGTATISMCSSISDGRSSGSHLVAAYAPENAKAYRDFEHATIQTRTGDRIIADDSALRPDLLKIDVEGAEALMLFGCRTLLLTHRPRLLIEVHHILAMHDCLQLLADCRYSVRMLDRMNNTQSRCFISAIPLNLDGSRQ